MTEQDPGPDATPTEASVELISEVSRAYRELADEVGKIVVGQHHVVEAVVTALFCRGHALLVGVPGLAKTLLISTIADTLKLDFNRIQFTPDLMPSDITGTEVIEENRTTGAREMRFVHGPIFANILLADEINRTPPKTQAALLEAMQEFHVTAGGERYDLPQPFFVLATQNPIEQEGTYPLPEAQLDRFMFMIRVGYPGADDELQIVRQTTARRHVELSHVLDAERVLKIQELVRDVPVADHVIQYALRLVRATRRPDRGQADDRPDFIREYLSWGAGPRAGQYLILAGKARAILQSRTHVTCEDVAAMAHPVLRHRMLVNFNAEADEIRPDDLIDQLLETIKPDAADASRQEMDTVLR